MEQTVFLSANCSCSTPTPFVSGSRRRYKKFRRRSSSTAVTRAAQPSTRGVIPRRPSTPGRPAIIMKNHLTSPRPPEGQGALPLLWRIGHRRYPRLTSLCVIYLASDASIEMNRWNPHCWSFLFCCVYMDVFILWKYMVAFSLVWDHRLLRNAIYECSLNLSRGINTYHPFICSNSGWCSVLHSCAISI